MGEKELSNNYSNKRIFKNTLILYFRQIITLLVALYTVRVILDVLGVEDYGVYNVIGGLVSLFSFFSATMTSATQRFFSYAIGEKNQESLFKTFSINIIIYLIIAILVSLLLETIGLWYVKNHLFIPEGRYEAVVFIFHCSIIGFVLNLFATPFKAIMIAHEHMKIYATLSIIEVVLRLGAVFLLMFIDYDKLELHAMLVLLSSFLMTIIYTLYSFNKYEEVQFKILYWDNIIFKQILNFTGWSFFGMFSTVIRSQGITILMNQMFSPVTVASRAIATNVASKVNMFSTNFNLGLYPSIIKSYSSENKQDMFRLINDGSKMTFFLMWVFALPLFLEMDLILNLWLKETPPEAVLFTRLSLVESVILSVSLPLATAARAPGKMKMYELVLGTLQLLIFGLAWIYVKNGYPAYSIYIIAIFINIIMFFARLFIVKKLIDIDIENYMKKVLLPLFLIVVLSILVTFPLKYVLPKGYIYSTIIFISSVSISSLSMFYIGLNKQYRTKIKNKFYTFIGK